MRYVWAFLYGVNLIFGAAVVLMPPFTWASAFLVAWCLMSAWMCWRNLRDENARLNKN